MIQKQHSTTHGGMHSCVNTVTSMIVLLLFLWCHCTQISWSPRIQPTASFSSLVLVQNVLIRHALVQTVIVSLVLVQCVTVSVVLVQSRIEAMSQFFHPHCFTCQHCNQTIGGSSFHVENNQFYCQKGMCTPQGADVIDMCCGGGAVAFSGSKAGSSCGWRLGDSLVVRPLTITCVTNSLSGFFSIVVFWFLAMILLLGLRLPSLLYALCWCWCWSSTPRSVSEPLTNAIRSVLRNHYTHGVVRHYDRLQGVVLMTMFLHLHINRRWLTRWRTRTTWTASSACNVTSPLAPAASILRKAKCTVRKVTTIQCWPTFPRVKLAFPLLCECLAVTV